MIEWKMGWEAGCTISTASEVARPKALLIVTKTASVKERPWTKFRSFSAAG